MAQGRGGSWRPRRGRGHSTQARKHASTHSTHSMRVDASATQSPPPSTQPRACAQKTRTHWTAVRTRAARAICTISTQARTACASTPVPRKAPHPAHTATRMCQKLRTNPTCAGCGPMRTALCCFHRAHRNTMRGSYTGAGIHGHWPAPKMSRKPTPACMYKHGKSARVRWPRAPIGGVCAHTGDRATWGLARQCVSGQMRRRKTFFVSRYSREQ